MNKDKIIPTHNGLERIRTYTIGEVFKWIDEHPRKTYWEDGDYRIKMTRAKIFKKKGMICSTCGLEGIYFILEEDKGGGIHLDLYGLENDVEILLTVDHIIPKSKGGVNNIVNYQTMCKYCNELKSDDNF